MKRIGNTYSKICDISVLRKAHENASKGKSHYPEVQAVNEDLDNHLNQLRLLLLSKNFKTSEYRVEERVEGGKLRELFILPYFPDRVVQHVIMLVIGPRLESYLIRDTFQSLKDRGTSDLFDRVRRAIDLKSPSHYLQMDVYKYYPSISQNILISFLYRFLKCFDTIMLLAGIIRSVCTGVPIGNYTSQILGNIYIGVVDWYIKQVLKPLGYFRYCDDLVLLGSDPEELHKNYLQIRDKMWRDLKLQIKEDYKLTHLESGLDVGGYIHYPNGYTLRHRTYAKATSEKFYYSKQSYKGWLNK